MQIIPIEAIANQSFTLTVDKNFYAIAIKETNGCMSVDLSRGGVSLLSGYRVAANTPLIPCKYQEAGNFMFITMDQALPYYTDFNDTQVLAYFTADELAAFRAPKVVFSPLGDLPLRYKPQGYKLAP